MGIKGLSEYIDNVVVSIKSYAGKKVAVDISIFLHRFIKIAGEDKWIPLLVNLLLLLKKYKIKTVCILDGEPPKEKLEERKKRRDSSGKVKEKVNELRDLISQVEELIEENKDSNESNEKSNSLEFDLELNLRHKIKEICMKQKDSDKFDAINYRNPHQSLKILKIIEEKFAKQCIVITREHSEMVKEICEYLGIPCIRALTEAETLCAVMCYKGIVDAVISEDSDVLCYKCPILLSHIDLKNETFSEIRYKNLVQKLDLTEEQFLDFCIMCGCDYNSRIKLPLSKTNKTGRQTGIGPAKAYKLIKEHGTIENIEYMTELDISPLNHERCRELFNPKMYEDLQFPYNGQIDFNKVERFLEKHNCKYMIGKVRELWTPTKISFDSSSEEDVSEEDIEESDSEEDNDENNENEVRPRLLKPFIESSFKKDPEEEVRPRLLKSIKPLKEEPHVRLIHSNIKKQDVENFSDLDDAESFNKNNNKKEELFVDFKKKISPRENRLKDEENSNLSKIPKIVKIEKDLNFDYIIFCDGACSPNPGVGGYAAVIIDTKKNEEFNVKGNSSQSTNNIMELTAALKGLQEVYKKEKNAKIKVYTDSEYVKNGIGWIGGWKRKGWMTANNTYVKNVDLWKSIDEFISKNSVEWEWVKATHTNKIDEQDYRIKYNNKADILAVSERKKKFNNSIL
jgi:flap endonuclease-1